MTVRAGLPPANEANGALGQYTVGGEQDGHFGTSTFFTDNIQAPAVARRQFHGDGNAKASALLAARHQAAYLTETLTRDLKLVGRHADPRVGNREPGTSVRHQALRDLDVAAMRREFYGIGHQIYQDLAYAAFVDPEP